MAEKHVVFSLRRKYADLKGILKYRRRNAPKGTLTALRQVGCVLHMFAPDENLDAIAPIRPHKPDYVRVWSRTAMDVLKGANGPLTTQEIAKRVAAIRGVTDEPALSSIECSLHVTLERRRAYGIVRLEGEPKRWKIS